MKKKPGDIIILHKCTTNHDHILYCSWDMACDTCNYYFSFWAIFCPFMLKKSKFEMKKAPEDIIILHMCTKNYDQMMYGSWDMVQNGRTDKRTDGQMNRRMNRWKKWHKEVSAPPKNEFSLTNETMKRKIDVWCYKHAFFEGHTFRLLRSYCSNALLLGINNYTF